MSLNIKLFGKKILSKYSHNIMSCARPDLPSSDIYAEEITLHNVDSCADTTFSLKQMKKYLTKQKQYVKGFLFRKKESGELIGYLWITFRCGNELEYKIRHIDAFASFVYVFPQFRGNGYAGKMLVTIMHSLNLKELYLAVRKDNYSAVRAYEKVGFEFKEQKSFFRLLRINVPYVRL